MPQRNTMLTLSNEQQAAVDRMASEPSRACLNASDTGVGKTLLAVELAKKLFTETVLIIGPVNKPVVNAWKNTFEGQGVTLPFRQIDSSHLDHFEMLHKKEPGVYYVGREFFYLSATSQDPSTSKGKTRKWTNHNFNYTRTTLNFKDNLLVYRLEISPFDSENVTPHPLDLDNHFGLGISFARKSPTVELKSFSDNTSVYEITAKIKPSRGHSDEGFTAGRAKRWSWSKVHSDLVVYDEVASVSNRWSEGFTVLKTLNAKYKLAMSATPQGNKFKGIWSVCRWLWPDTIDPKTEQLYVDNSQWRWAAEWAIIEPCEYAGKKITKERNPGAFVQSLPCYIRIEAERTPVETRVVKVDLTPKQRKMYDKMEKDMLVWIDEHPLVADIPMVQRMRMRQITLGEPTLNFVGEDEDGLPMFDVDFDLMCESAKADAIEIIISKYHPNDNLFILMDSQKFARVLAYRLGTQAAEWSGAVPHKERQRIFSEFGKSIKYIVATIPAVAEGLNGLQHVCHTEVWVSQSMNEMYNEQARGRINRRGQEADKIIRYYLQARETDDDRHFQNLLDQHISQRATLKVSKI